MPSKKFRVQSQLFEAIHLSWTFPFKNIHIHADDVVIGSGLKDSDLQRGKEFLLHDGTKIRIRRLYSWPNMKIEIHINDHLIPLKEPPFFSRLFGFFL